MSNLDRERREGLYLKFSEPMMEPHTPVIIERVNGNCTVSQFIIARDEAYKLINQLREFLSGSPRKVGEDGDSHLSGRIAARLDEHKFVAQMISGVEKEDWFKRRVANLESMYAASSVPVGEQKQEEGV